MFDLIALKSEAALILNNFAQAVVTEMFTCSNKQKLETEEKLDTLVVEAVDRILEMVKMMTPQRLMTSADGEAGGEPPPPGHAYVLFDGSGAVGAACLLPLQSDADANRENKMDDIRPPRIGPSPSCPPPQADHQYALPSSPLPSAAPAADNGASAARGTKRRRSKTDVEMSPPAEAAGRPHQCPRCGMLFPTTERLSDHERKSHPACSACGALFTGVLRLREHEMKEHGLLPYACDHCPKRFNHKAHRDLHVRARHTGEKTCQCDICGRSYACVSVLKTHRKTHFDKTFVCDVCGKSFYHACHLTRHKVVHQEVRPHQCATCGRGFTQAANLRSHQATHSGERQLCSVCGRSYRCLRNHLISKHPQELPAGEPRDGGASATCQVCGKRFPNPSQLKAHQRSHTGEKPFHCGVCGRSYRLKEQLRDHAYTHSGEKPYRCPFCPKTFNMAATLTRHRSIHSGETPFSCGACGKRFRLLAFLKTHLQTKAHLMQVQQSTSPLTSDL